MMQLTLPKQISSKQLAAILCISERAVHLRAKKGGWPCIYKKCKGGASHFYMVSGLPDDVRVCLIRKLQPAFIGQAAQAGYARGKELTREVEVTRQQAREAGLAAYECLPDARRAEADARLEILRSRDAFLAASMLPKKRGSALFIREYKSGNIKMPKEVANALRSDTSQVPLSWASLYRWEKAYNEHGIAGLASGYKSTRGTCIAAHIQEFIKGLLCDRPHLSIPTVHQAIQARFDGQVISSQSAIRRFVNKWRAENKNLICYITSPDEWRNRHMIAMGQADEQVTRLNQVWEFDSTPGDVMLIDGRHNLIGVIDVYSRRAKLHVTPTSKAAAIAALTRRAILDWGVPETAKTDNGADYVSAHIVRVFDDLEIEQILCRPFHPEDKPYIERFFYTVLHSIFELLPGYIGHSVAERKRIENRRSFAQRIMSQGQDPVEIKLTAAELQIICDRWCDAVYHHNVHGNLNGKTPAQAAREWTNPVRRIEDERCLDILLSPAPDKSGMRVIEKKGIKVQNSHYYAPEFGGHVGKRVFVLLDATDYGSVHVFLIQNGGKEYLCRAVDPSRTGHDRAEIAAKAKAYQKRYMREAAAELKRIARAAATERIHEEILSFREQQRANIREFPQRSKIYTTPAIEEASRAMKAPGSQPIEINAEQNAAAAELIDMAQAMSNNRPLPATAQEKYEQIESDLRAGIDIPDTDLAWMKRYELWIENGESMAKG